MMNLLSAFGGLEIAIIAVLAVVTIALIATDSALVVRNRRRRQQAAGEPTIVYVPVPQPAEPAPEPEPEPEQEETQILQFPTPEPEPAPEPVPAPAVITAEQEELYQRLKLDRSFTAKLIQTEEETKQMYMELKNELLSYDGVKDRMSWRRETYRKARTTLARFGVRGKTLCLYLALDPAEYAESKYKAEDASAHSSFADTPLMYRIKNGLRMRYAKELIAQLMEQQGIARIEREPADYSEELAYRNTPVLIEEGLIRVPEGMELPTFEPAPAPEPEPVPAPAVITAEQEELYQRLKLDRSFTAKLIQTEEETKQMYMELKNELLSYDGVKDRMSWRRETYRKARTMLARFGVRGKTLCLYLALDPAEYAESKYKAEDASAHSSFADTPLMYRIKNGLRMRYAKELIAQLMEQQGIARIEREPADYSEELAYRNTPVLIEEGLIRVPEGMELPTFEPAPVAEEIAPAEPAEEVAPAAEAFIQPQLDRSFTARLIQADEETKEWYSDIKNALLGYKGVKDRMSWRRETYRKSRVALARCEMRGKTLCLYLALDPAEYAGGKYKAEDVSSRRAVADTPLLYRIKSALRMRYAQELIAILMEQQGIAERERAEEDYAAALAYRETNELIEEGLIRVPEGAEQPAPAPVVETPIVEETPIIEEAPAVEAAPAAEAFIQPQLDRSFTARLIQADEETKEWYSDIKNALLGYKGVKDRMSWRRETYRKSRVALARCEMRGKTLCLYLALDPAEYLGGKYKAEDVSSRRAVADTPLLYRIKSALRMRYAQELIAILMEQQGVAERERAEEDYAAALAYRETDELIGEGLIRVPEGAEGESAQPAPAPVIEETPVIEEIAPSEVVEEIAPAEAAEAAEEPAEAIGEPVPAEPAVEQPAPVSSAFAQAKYDKSFTAKLIQADEETKEWYSDIKNALLGYKGVKDRMSWRRETYRKSRVALARFGVRGKTLCLYLALDPAEYIGGKYKAEDVSGSRSFADTPLLYRIKSALRMRYARELIAQLMEQHGIADIEREPADYTGELSYRETDELIEEGLIRLPEGSGE